MDTIKEDYASDAELWAAGYSVPCVVCGKLIEPDDEDKDETADGAAICGDCARYCIECGNLIEPGEEPAIDETRAMFCEDCRNFMDTEDL